MKNKNNNIYFEIDFIKIFKKEKSIIILLPLLFVITGYLYSTTLLLKKFETSVKLHPPKLLSIRSLDHFFKLGSGIADFEKIQEDFFINFKDETLSSTNFANFLTYYPEEQLYKKNNKHNFYENNLIIFVEKNFKEKKKIVNKENKSVEIIFTYPEDINGPKILDDYITFMRDRSVNNLTEQAIEEISIETINLEIKKKNYYIFKTKEINDRIFKLKISLKEYIDNRKKNLNTQVLQLELNIKEYKKRKTRSLENLLIDYEQALEVAKSINLEETIPTSILKEGSGSVLNEPIDLFYKGTKVLSAEINNIKDDLKNLERGETYNDLVSNMDLLKNQLLTLGQTLEYNAILAQIEISKNHLLNIDKTEGYNELLRLEKFYKNNINLIKEFNFSWNPILQKSTDPLNYIFPNHYLYALKGLLLGSFFMLIIIFIKYLRIIVK